MFLKKNVKFQWNKRNLVVRTKFYDIFTIEFSSQLKGTLAPSFFLLFISALSFPRVWLWEKFWLISQCCCCCCCGARPMVLYCKDWQPLAAVFSWLLRRFGRGGNGGISTVLGGSGGAWTAKTAPKIPPRMRDKYHKNLVSISSYQLGNN